MSAPEEDHSYQDVEGGGEMGSGGGSGQLSQLIQSCLNQSLGKLEARIGARLAALEGSKVAEGSSGRNQAGRPTPRVQFGQPEYFSGEGGVLFGDWWFSITEYLDLNGIVEDRDKIKYAGSMLRELPKTWYRSLCEQKGRNGEVLQ